MVVLQGGSCCDTPGDVHGVVIVCRDGRRVAHDGSGGVSPEGWLPDRVSLGALSRTFSPELVDRVVATTGTKEVRRRLLPARFVMYFVLALWLFRGRNCGYGQVMIKLVDGLCHRRRARDLLDGVPDPQGCSAAGCVWCRWTVRAPMCPPPRRTPSTSVARRTGPGTEHFRRCAGSSRRSRAPDPAEIVGRGTVLVDGTVCPTWDWSHVPDLFSGKVGFPGMNLQIAAT
ncbi:MAG: transposase domain-containing protein, partial [Pseudonocardia sp.]|nr:transposase domain-containing protein [Pseudonocardia sp.]